MSGIDPLVWAWGILALLAILVETLTLAFLSLYVVLGAAAAAVAAALGAPLWGQLLVFAVVSVGSLVFSRPYLVSRLRTEDPPQPSNVDRMIGARGIVTDEILNDASRGQIRVETEYWSARSADDPTTAIPAETPVEIVRVDGVMAYCRPVAAPAARNDATPAP